MPKSKHQVPGRVRSTYAFIKAHRDRHSVQMMCRVLEVGVSGYYAWLKQPISNHAQEDARLCRLVHASFIASHGIYGAQQPQEGTNQEADLQEPRAGDGGDCSLHRQLLQFNPPPQPSGRRES
jgi:putative transposase